MLILCSLPVLTISRSYCFSWRISSGRFIFPINLVSHAWFPQGQSLLCNSPHFRLCPALSFLLRTSSSNALLGLD
ncbi:hypothetical protein B0H19DRAFT_1181754 [Mycena capillaripes]|nr:hypothetical protein B0H19DRAFT_1181754 [Mycena capillaripes]